MLMKQSEWARKQGFERQYVSSLVKQGHIVLENGMVNVEQAEAELAAMRNPSKPLKRKASKPSVASQSGQSTAELSTFLLKTRIKNEVERGKMLEIEAKAKTGQYVDAKDVEKQAFQTARTVRDSLQNIPDRVSSLLASISDANQIYDVLSKEIRQVLEDLAEGLR
jgi:phage terminase Nu1 subunit (DNA packaging protein)